MEQLNKDYVIGEKDLRVQQQKYMGKIAVLGQDAKKKLDQEIPNEQAASSRNAPPPQPRHKEKLTNAPPNNLDQKEWGKAPKEVKMVEERSSEESETWGKIQSEPIDIDQYEFATGAKIRMKMPAMKGKTPAREKGT